LHGGIVYGHLLTIGLMERDTALDPRAVGFGWHHQILDSHVGKGTAHHYFVIAAARTVAVEVGLADAVPDQIFAGRGSVFDRTGRADVVGRHRVAEDPQPASAKDVSDRPQPHAEVVEERRLRDVGRFGPVVNLPG